MMEPLIATMTSIAAASAADEGPAGISFPPSTALLSFRRVLPLFIGVTAWAMPFSDRRGNECASRMMSSIDPRRIEYYFQLKIK